MIPGGAVNNTPRSCVPGFGSFVCSLKMHCGARSPYSFCPLKSAASYPPFKYNTDSIARAVIV
ncbi:uncharacterized protein N7518_000451 [Penicillium psychrosexuale]|uniref:uncharacterized protein n=1 Tax=Penicillium psychrosexuale TaxID=1002107 RepID=UPI0025450E9D|nr:uncharacterized protein N7518_000451 [Penicillium psychrosexuale]KAJ5804148.1 hypothetical protein N7518_000451 [Penicillium psychrosexuale]